MRKHQASSSSIVRYALHGVSTTSISLSPFNTFIKEFDLNANLSQLVDSLNGVSPFSGRRVFCADVEHYSRCYQQTVAAFAR